MEYSNNRQMSANEQIDASYFNLILWTVAGFGALVLACCLIKLLYNVILGFRLYVSSQYCCSKTDYVERYGKWAVISGATDGIGLAMARNLAQRGLSIIVIGRNQEKLADTKALLEREQNVGEVVTIRIDLADSSVENFESVREQLSVDKREIGILINNAGAAARALKRWHRYKLGEFREIVSVNSLAAAYLASMVLPAMAERRKGLILNVSSLTSTSDLAFMGPYIATKAFMDALSRQLAIEYYKYSIDVINLNPGSVLTKLATGVTSDGSHHRRVSLINLTPEDFADSALNALSCRISPYSGCLSHGIFGLLLKIPCPDFIRMRLVEPGMRAYGMELFVSPVLKRRAIIKDQRPENKSSDNPVYTRKGSM